MTGTASLLVTMGCGESCPYVPVLKRVDWPLPDPKGRSAEEVRAIRYSIRSRVAELVTEDIVDRRTVCVHPVGWEAMTICLQPAKMADLPAIAVLMNAAFRGTASERSWCVETGYITGERTTESLLRKELAMGARLLIAKDDSTSVLQGCVSLHASSPETWYLGSLTVNPALQNTGIGRELLCTAEEYAASQGARRIEMTVVNVRDTLISWYERSGYFPTGEKRPFPYGDNRFGTPTRDDLEFVVLDISLHG